MPIDGFTVVAQAINFLILVWLMKRFLYRPILDAIDSREARIAAELAEADAKRAEAGRERDEFRRRNDELDRRRAALLKEAADEAEAERQRLIDEAREAADALGAQRMEALRREALGLKRAIGLRTREEVFAVARKALRDLAGTGLEERMGEVFVGRLRAMDGEARERFAEAVRTASEPALVRSAFDLPEAQRAAIRDALHETASAEIPVRFETAPDLVGGIEVAANGRKLAWTIADYLDAMERHVGELLEDRDRREAGGGPGRDAGPGTPRP